ncbi:MAG: peroxiredoxin-like family protein [bacterium]
MRLALCGLLATLLLSLPALAEETTPASPPTATTPSTVTAEPEQPVLGLTVGEAVPEFKLMGTDGELVSLQQDLLGKGQWIVLVTYRGGWCPFCNTHLQALRELPPDLATRGARLVAVSVDTPANEQATIEAHDLGFLVLSDPTAAMLGDYHLQNHMDDATVEKYVGYGIDLHAASGQDHQIIAHPAVLLIDPEGILRFQHVNPDYKVRLSPTEILDALDAAQTVAESAMLATP